MTKMPSTHGGSSRPSPKADEASKALFRTLVPDDERVTVKPMFGAVAAFANGYMFMGLFAADLFVRLSADDDAAVRESGGADLEPMPGKPMKGYVTVPDWQAHPAEVRAWGEKSLDYTMSLPPKTK
jgi:TfoX/Sxy family transcriptional regulator of competence genes